MLISLDIETSCNVPTCVGFGHSKKCEHALVPHTSKIDVIGLYWKDTAGNPKQQVFRDLNLFSEFFEAMGGFDLIGHNLKFDIKQLLHVGIDLRPYFAHDTSCMAVAFDDKISKKWLDEYEENRKIINKQSKTKHRKAGRFSLKTLAPFYLKVIPFWEVDEKDDDEYVLKDAKYTYQLYEFFSRKLKEKDDYNFYLKLMEWDRLLLNMEITGIKLDLNQLKEDKKQVEKDIESLKKELDVAWKSAHEAYIELEKGNVTEKYINMFNEAIKKMEAKYPPEDISPEDRNKLYEKYAKLRDKALEKFDVTGVNYDSPAQLMGLLNTHYGYSVINDEGEASTGHAVMEKLILEGKEDIKLFQELRQKQKLISSFYDPYIEKLYKGNLHCNFNITGTRTGRLSSSGPNLQQVPPELHKCFIARPGYKLATFDLSGIEPVVIAYLSEDKKLCEILIEGHNFHNVVTKNIFDWVTCDAQDVKKKFPKERDLAKQVDLSLFYGSGRNRLLTTAINHGFKLSEKDANNILKKFKGMFFEVFDYKQKLDSKMLHNTEYNLFGRPIVIDDPEDIYMTAFNTLVQSSASDLCLESANKIQKELTQKKIDGKVLLIVHDEIVIEVPEDSVKECEEIIVRNMTSYKLMTKYGRIPLKVEGHICDYWKK